MDFAFIAPRTRPHEQLSVESNWIDLPEGSRTVTEAKEMYGQ